MKFCQAGLHCLQTLRAILCPNHVTDMDQIAGNVTALAVNRDMTMTDQLPRLCSRQAKTQSTNNIVQASLEQAHQSLAGISLPFDGTLVVGTKLPFQNAIVMFDLLLLAQMYAVVR